MPIPDSRPPVLFLMGPTASGKTALAVALVQRLPFEIVSVAPAVEPENTMEFVGVVGSSVIRR